MKRNKKTEKKTRIIYDIIPSRLMKDIVLVEKKISRTTKAFYLFLKTSKYGSVILVLAVAIFGGAIIMGFSPKTEITEIYPAQYEGDWQNMEKALNRELSDKADILEFNFDNSAGVFKIEEEVLSLPEGETEKVEDIELIEDMEEGVQAGDTEPMVRDIEPTDDIDQIEDNQTPPNLPLSGEEPAQEGSTQSMEPATGQDMEPMEDISFFKKTKGLFSVLEARAEESIGDESQIKTEKADNEELANDGVPAQNEDVAIEEVQDNQDSEKDLDKKEIADDDIDRNSESKGNGKESYSNDSSPNGTMEPSKQEGSTQSMEQTDKDEETDNDIDENEQDKKKNGEDKEEKFEDYAGMIIIPDVDGNLLFETEEDKKEEKAQTIFTKELNAVYSDFSILEEKGELKKIKIGFSFASLEKENENDEIIVSWSLNGEDWNSASEFVLDKNYSNKDNGGYFYTDIFDLSDSDNDTILQREDVENIKVKFSYLTNNNEENYVPFFLDAVWLETESEKLDEESDEKEKIEVLSHKKDFKINEEPEFKFKYKKEKEGFLVSIGEAIGIIDYWNDINLTAEIIEPNGETFKIPSEEFSNFSGIFTLGENGEILMKLKKDKKFKPGLYKIILKIEENGNIQTLEQDFTWGVLAINVNKSIYLPGEEAYLQMAVLRDDGHTICNARLELRIWNLEFGIETLLSTEDETIQYSGQCSGDNVTDVPDYFAYYTTSEAGVYEMTLTNLDNGYEITDDFEVRDFVPFEIERIGPSRIYPPADYEMVLKIKVNEEFVGFIQEKTPASFIIIKQELRIKNQESGEFEIYNGQFITQNENDNIKLLRWHDLNLKQNDELEIRYVFDAPDVSPDLHLLGPLGFYE
ncbi:hypothetical protein KAT63_03980 [Candidatus Parcubacteria bacterium]|nr:hypothetical protein [Candidatus Parcubacteria bacterium]